MQDDDEDGTPDLDAIKTVADLADALRRIRARIGNPSLRAIQSWGEHHGRSLPRQTVSSMLNGERLPRRELLTGFLLACSVPPMEIRRWLAVWQRLAKPGQRGPSPATRSPVNRPTDDWRQDVAAIHRLMHEGWIWRPPARLRDRGEVTNDKDPATGAGSDDPSSRRKLGPDRPTLPDAALPGFVWRGLPDRDPDPTRLAWARGRVTGLGGPSMTWRTRRPAGRPLLVG
jgi:hypothetical protein